MAMEPFTFGIEYKETLTGTGSAQARKNLQKTQQEFGRYNRIMKEGAKIQEDATKAATESTWKEMDAHNKITDARKYANVLLGKNAKTWEEMNKTMGKSGRLASVAKQAEIDGYETLTKKQAETVQRRAQEIETAERLGTKVTESFEGQNKAITAFNNLLKSHDAAIATSATSEEAVAAAIKKEGAARGYVNTLLNSNSKQYRELSPIMDKYGITASAAMELEKKGYAAIGPELKKQLADRTKQIEMIEKQGVAVDKSTQVQNKNIKELNNSLKAHHTVWGGVKTSASTALGMVKKVGLTFLTLIGPLFLVSAAMRTFQNAVRWALDPTINFESALFNVRKIADLTNEEMKELGDTMILMSRRLPITAENLLKISEEAARLGIVGVQNISAFTDVVAKMAQITDMSEKEISEALGKVSIAMGVPVPMINRLASTIAILDTTTAASTSEIVKGMERVGATGKQIGFLEKDIAAMITTLVSAGQSGERSGTRLRRVFEELAKDYSQMAAQMGISSEKMKENIERDPTKAIMEYLAFLNKVESGTERVRLATEVFGTVGGFAISTLAEQYPALLENMELANDEMSYATSLEKKYASQTDKTSLQLEILNNRIKAARIEIGRGFVPALISWKEVYADILEIIGDINRGFQGATEEGANFVNVMDLLATELDRIEDLESVKPTFWEGYGAFIKKGLLSAALGAYFFRKLAKASEDIPESLEPTSKEVAAFAPLQTRANVLVADSVKLYKDWGIPLEDVGKTFKEYNVDFKEHGIYLEKAGHRLQKYSEYNEKYGEIMRAVADSDLEASKKQDIYNKMQRIGERRTYDAAVAEVTLLRAKQLASEVSEEAPKLTVEESNRLSELITYLSRASKYVTDEVSIEKEWADIQKTLNEIIGDAEAPVLLFEQALEALTIAQIEVERTERKLSETSWDLWDVTENLADEYSNLFSTYNKMKDLEKDENRRTRRLIRGYKGRINGISNLIGEAVELEQSGDRVAASQKIQQAATESNTISEELYTRAMKSRRKNVREGYAGMFEYWTSQLGFIQGSTKGVGDLDAEFASLTSSLAPVGKGLEKSIPEQLTEARSQVDLIKSQIETITVPDNFKEQWSVENWGGIYEQVVLTVDKLKELPDFEMPIRADIDTFYTDITSYLEENPLSTDINIREWKGKTFAAWLAEQSIKVKLTTEEGEESEVTGSFTTVPSKQKGGPIEETGLYKLHEGEYVVPKDRFEGKDLLTFAKEEQREWEQEWEAAYMKGLKHYYNELVGFSIEFNAAEKEIFRNIGEVARTLNWAIETIGGSKLPARLAHEGTVKLVYGTAGLIEDVKSLFKKGEMEQLGVEEMQKGGRIEETGIYKLHKGEEVTPTKEVGKDVSQTVTVNFPNMIVRETIDVNKIASKITDVVNTKLSNRLLR